MSWNCPHLINNECVRLRKACQPLQKDCVLESKVKFIDSQLDSTDKKDLEKEGKQNGKTRSNYRIQRRS